MIHPFDDPLVIAGQVCKYVTKRMRRSSIDQLIHLLCLGYHWHGDFAPDDGDKVGCYLCLLWRRWYACRYCRIRKACPARSQGTPKLIMLI